MGLEYVDWDIGEVTVINLAGRITLGQGTQRLRQSILEVLERGRRQILLNFEEVFYVDSSGLGELVASGKKVMGAGGNLKLMKLNQITRDLIQVTRLYTVFEVFADEASAMKSFQGPVPPSNPSV
jgi:anti-sigma B factor antagonist